MMCSLLLSVAMKTFRCIIVYLHHTTIGTYISYIFSCRYEYLSGFRAYLQSEALPGTVPQRQRSPRFPAHGLIAECITGSPFCAPRDNNFFSWFYRIHPSVGSHGVFEQIHHPTLKGAFEKSGTATPEPVMWNAPPEPKTNADAVGLDFVDSLFTLAGTGNPASLKGLAIHTWVPSI